MATTLADPNGPESPLTLAKPKPVLQQGQQLALAPQSPGMAGGAPPPMTPPTGAPQLSMAAPAIPAPTVAAPSAPVDRVKLATQAWDTFAKSTDPAYQKTLRDTTSNAAAGGQLMSGQFRTSLGDAANNRQLQLDTQRDTLINKATEGSIADASTAYGQALAGAQQGLAGELGRGNLALGGRAADTAEKGTTGQLALAEKGLAQSGEQFGQSLGFQKEQAAIEAAFKAGTMTLAEKDQKLRELSNQQAYGLEGQKLELAKTGQEANIGQGQQQLDLAKKTADINAAYQAGTLSLAQKDQALRELSNQQQNTIATGQLSLAQKGQEISQEQFKASLAQNAGQFDRSLAQSGDQFKASLAQNAQQFGLSQEQTMALAKLNDATQNRQIDVSQAQGKNQLLIQLAAILGGPTGALNPNVLAGIAKQFGVVVPTTTTGPKPGDIDPATGKPFTTTPTTTEPPVPTGGFKAE